MGMTSKTPLVDPQVPSNLFGLPLSLLVRHCCQDQQHQATLQATNFNKKISGNWEHKHSKAPACMHAWNLSGTFSTNGQVVSGSGVACRMFPTVHGPGTCHIHTPIYPCISPNIKTIESSVKQTPATSLSDLVNWERQKHQKHLKNLNTKTFK